MREILRIKTSSICPVCSGKISMWDIFKSFWPQCTYCHACKSKLFIKMPYHNTFFVFLAVLSFVIIAIYAYLLFLKNSPLIAWVFLLSSAVIMEIGIDILYFNCASFLKESHEHKETEL